MRSIKARSGSKMIKKISRNGRISPELGDINVTDYEILAMPSKMFNQLVTKFGRIWVKVEKKPEMF